MSIKRVLLLSLALAATIAAEAQKLSKAVTRAHWPEKIEVEQIVSAQAEQRRLGDWHNKFDHVLTGFYADSAARIEVDMKTLVAPGNDRDSVYLVVGTPIRVGDRRKTYALKEGRNVVTAEKGGMIYLRFVSDDRDPVGRAVVTFRGKSGHRRAPRYIKGVTGHDEFRDMMALYPTRDAMMQTDLAVFVFGREWVEKYSVNEDKEAWLSKIDRILDIEDDISGLNDDDPNPLHHRLVPGIRHLFVDANPVNGAMYSTNWATGYFNDFAMVRILTDSMIAHNNWGMAHELGHQHQQSAYFTRTLQETTVNLPTLAVQRSFYDNYTRAPQGHWDRLFSMYFGMPVEERNYLRGGSYVTGGSQFAAVTGGSLDASRLLMFEQLYYIFGDDYVRRLFRMTREDVAAGLRRAVDRRRSEDDNHLYLAKQLCRATGYDLRDYLRTWGYVQGLSAESQAALDAYVAELNLQLPPHNDELPYVTGFDHKERAYLPIPMR